MTILKKLLFVALLALTGSSFVECNHMLDQTLDTLTKIDPALTRRETLLGTTMLTPGIALLSRGHKLVVKHGSKVIGNALRIPGGGLVGFSIFCIATAINETR
jgi:hypothetical protein